METKDLMIGDLVRKLERGGHSIPVKIIAIYEHNADYETEDGHTGCMSIHGYEPRLLTPKILERIQLAPNMSVEWDDRKTEETGEDWYELRIHNGPDTALCLQIRYIHEFQHAMRLCGIDHKIEL